MLYKTSDKIHAVTLILQYGELSTKI